MLGTRVSGPDGDRPGVGARTRTAVDRVRGSAREHMLFTQQGLDAGTLVDVWLLSEAPLDDALDALASWHPSLGRGTTSGAGRTRLVHLRHTSIDLATPEGRRTWLSGLGPERVSALCTHEVPVAAPDTPADELRWTATIVDGLHVGTGHKQPETATPVQRLPDGTPYVPGTAIKGVFRSRVAYICDSLVDPPDAEHEVCTRDTVIPCPVCVLFGNTARRGLLHFADAPIADATVVEQPHVAIDRFTGGAHDGKLWTDEVVTAGTFPLVITSPRPLSTTHRRLLEHAAADLHDGYAAFGGRTGRGHGTVRLDPPPAPEPLGADELPRLRPLELPRDEP
ncbi:MAG: DNA repair protein [Actinomyces sp.]|nr:MAG: DNA repair protein [Actinomyces sp.]